MLNVTHFDWTIEQHPYGRRVSRLVGGKPFVVSTVLQRPRTGPLPGRATASASTCSATSRYRGAGPLPTTSTGYAKVDAFLWLNRPGISGAGRCNGGPA